MAEKMSYNLDQKPGESLEKYYHRLAKTADQRMVRLESYEHDKYFKPATQWAYSRAQHDLQRWTGQGPEVKKLRFNTAAPKDPEQLISKINDIRTFLASPTSTKKGIIDVYKKRADTINKKYGTQFDWKSLAKYYDSGQADLWDSKFGSKTALYTIAEIQKKGKKEIEEIKKAEEKDMRAETPTMADKMVRKALKDNELNIEDLY